MPLDPRHEREGIDGDPVRPKLDHLLERAPESGDGLQRQAVDQVDVDRAEPGRAGADEHVLRLLERLHAMDRLLDVGREILDPRRQAVEPESAQRLEVRRVGRAGIDLDADLRVAREREPLGDRGHEARELERGVVRRRAAAPVELRQRAPARQVAGEQVDLLEQVAEIVPRDAVVRRDHDVAAAVEAALAAERQVRVE